MTKFAIYPGYDYFPINEIPDCLGDDYMVIEGDEDDVDENGVPKCVADAWFNRIQDPVSCPFNHP